MAKFLSSLKLANASTLLGVKLSNKIGLFQKVSAIKLHCHSHRFSHIGGSSFSVMPENEIDKIKDKIAIKMPERKVRLKLCVKTVIVL